MPHEVFISYPSINKLIADAVCAKLEEEKIRCWIAPRDVLPEEKWGGSIIKAIDNSKIMILIFSKDANVSPHILNEVNRALNNACIIIPFRIDEIIPEDDLAYYLETAHWLDAFTPPIEKHIEELTHHVKRHLSPVINQIKGNFSYSISNENNNKVNFQNLSQENFDHFSWSFGDGESSNERNPEHIYNDSGEYYVTLIISDNEQHESISKKISLLGNPIIPQFSYRKEILTDSVIVHFLDETQHIVDKYLWNFGDNSNSIEKNPTHIFSKNGVYTVTLTVFKGNQNGSISNDINIDLIMRESTNNKFQAHTGQMSPQNIKNDKKTNSLNSIFENVTFNKEKYCDENDIISNPERDYHQRITKNLGLKYNHPEIHKKQKRSPLNISNKLIITLEIPILIIIAIIILFFVIGGTSFSTLSTNSSVITPSTQVQTNPLPDNPNSIINTFHGNPAHTGFFPGPAALEGALEWKVKVGKELHLGYISSNDDYMGVSSPTVADGTVFIGSWDKNLYAIDVRSGKIIWKYQMEDAISASPTVAYGNVYVDGDNDNLFAIDAKSGKLIWKCQIEGEIGSNPNVANGIVYVGSYDYNLYAIDAESGKIIWKFKTGKEITSTPAIAEGNIYVGSSDTNLYALDAKSGRLKWKFWTGNDIKSSPAVANGNVYFTAIASDKNLYAVETESGKLKWKFKVGFTKSSPAVVNGIVYVGGDKGNLFAIDAESGTLKWKYNTGIYNIDLAPGVAEGIVYIGCWDNNLYAINADSGTLLWKYQTGGSIDSSPSIVNGAVFINSNDKNLYKIK